MTMATTERYLDPEKILSHLTLKPGMRVGDFGVGGEAFYAIPIGKRVGQSGEVYLFDIVKNALGSAMSMMQIHGLKNAKAVWSNLEMFEGARGIGKNSLDAGALISVLSQSQKPKDILAELQRMLKVGSQLLVVDWHPSTELGFAPDKRRRLAAERVEQLARDLGFATQEAFEAGPHHWGLVFVKT